MVELIAKTPCAGLLPLTIGTLTLTELVPSHVTSIAPFAGQEQAVSEALRNALDLSLPGPGETRGDDSARLIWMGRGQIFLIGPAAPEGLEQIAALTDQTDGWAMMRLTGERTTNVLSRLCPLDLRAISFAAGQTARTEFAHMMGSITRVDDQSFNLMVMRSFARTAVHDLSLAMKSVTARANG